MMWQLLKACWHLWRGLVVERGLRLRAEARVQELEKKT